MTHSGETFIGIKAHSHAAAGVPQWFLLQPLPHMLLHRMGLEPIYLWHLVAPLPHPHQCEQIHLIQWNPIDSGIIATAIAAPCEWIFTP